MSTMPPPKYSRVECIEVLSTPEPFIPTIREVHAFVHHLTPRAPFADVRVKVGDRVRICWDDSADAHAVVSDGHHRVLEVCQFRGVRTIYGWHRSWIRVTGGAK